MNAPARTIHRPSPTTIIGGAVVALVGMALLYLQWREVQDGTGTVYMAAVVGGGLAALTGLGVSLRGLLVRMCAQMPCPRPPLHPGLRDGHVQTMRPQRVLNRGCEGMASG